MRSSGVKEVREERRVGDDFLPREAKDTKDIEVHSLQSGSLCRSRLQRLQFFAETLKSTFEIGPPSP